MRRNIIYLLILLILGSLVYYFVFLKGNSTLSFSERNISVKDTADIGRIFIADMHGNKLEVVKKDNIWIVNDKFPARKDAVNLILSTLKGMTVRYPVQNAAMNTVISDLATRNIKVEVYSKKGEKIESLLIGGPPLDNTGSYMLIEGTKTPFVAEMPGFQGSLDTRFIVDENEMRSHNIITIPLPMLSEVQVKYLDRPDSSFAINVQHPDSFLISNPDNKSSLPASMIDKDKVFAYLDFLKQVNCEGYANNIPSKDSIIKAGPYCIITLVKRNNTQQVIKLFHRPIDKRSMMQSDVNGKPLQYDLDRFYGLINDDKDFVLLQQYHFGRLLKNTNYFRK